MHITYIMCIYECSQGRMHTIIHTSIRIQSIILFVRDACTPSPLPSNNTPENRLMARSFLLSKTCKHITHMRTRKLPAGKAFIAMHLSSCTHTRKHARTHTRTHTRPHASTHARMHMQTKETQSEASFAMYPSCRWRYLGTLVCHRLACQSLARTLYKSTHINIQIDRQSYKYVHKVNNHEWRPLISAPQTCVHVCIRTE